MNALRVQPFILLMFSLSPTECKTDGQKPKTDAPTITIATVQKKAVTITREYVCKISALHHIEVRAPAEGYVVAIAVKEGQAVKRNDLLFQVRQLADKEKPEAEKEGKSVSITAPFEGLIGRLPRQTGSLVLKGETLTTLSDNSLMRAEFNVPEARYLEHISGNAKQQKEDPKIELVLANGNKYHQPGKLAAIGTEFNAGQVVFRADFPNPERLIRHGQTGTLLISQAWNDAVVVPQRATFEILTKRYVYVVDKNDVVHQREVVIQHESDEFFVVKSGVAVGEKVVLDGGGRVRDGNTVKY